jgi:hypothetical protein
MDHSTDGNCNAARFPDHSIGRQTSIISYGVPLNSSELIYL